MSTSFYMQFGGQQADTQLDLGLSHPFDPIQVTEHDIAGYMGANWQTPGYSATANNSGSDGLKPIPYTPSGVAYTDDWSKLQKEITNPVQASNYLKENADYTYISGTTPMDPATANKQKVTDCKTAAAEIASLVMDDGWTGSIVGYEYKDQPKNGHTFAIVEKPGQEAYLCSTYDVYGIASMADAWKIETDRTGSAHTIGNSVSFPLSYQGPTAAW